MIDSSNIVDFAGRPRRLRHDSSRSYCGERARTLELRGILEVLSAYDGYEGGINCCMCGKLYKSKVCFIKHLWEHSVYWDVFPGEKNHERVLAIQAAIILYSRYQGMSVEDTEKLMDLLVTSPHVNETVCPGSSQKRKPLQQTYPTTPNKSRPIVSHNEVMALQPPALHVTSTTAQYPTTPEKRPPRECPATPQKRAVQVTPGTPENIVTPPCPRTPRKRPAASQLRAVKKSRKKLRME